MLKLKIYYNISHHSFLDKRGKSRLILSLRSSWGFTFVVCLVLLQLRGRVCEPLLTDTLSSRHPRRAPRHTSHTPRSSLFLSFILLWLTNYIHFLFFFISLYKEKLLFIDISWDSSLIFNNGIFILIFFSFLYHLILVHFSSLQSSFFNISLLELALVFHQWLFSFPAHSPSLSIFLSLLSKGLISHWRVHFRLKCIIPGTGMKLNWLELSSSYAFNNINEPALSNTYYIIGHPESPRVAPDELSTGIQYYC